MGDTPTVFFVSADLGNTRLKLCAWSRVEGGLAQASEQVSFHGPDLLAEASVWLGRLGSTPRIGLVSVASDAARSTLLRVLEQAGSVEPLEHGLTIRCARPESVGLDRLFAARGALAHLGQDCLVLDAGTALTVDAVLAQDGGIFLGGAIAPGPELLAQSLAAGAAQLPAVEPLPGVKALGGDTLEAIRSGVAIGFRGAARELAACIGRESGLEDAPVMLTGGARGFLLQPEPVFGARSVEVPELVHLGLLAAAGEVKVSS